MYEINQNEEIPNFIEFNLDDDAQQKTIQNNKKLKNEKKNFNEKDTNSNNNYNLENENISSFDSNEFSKMDLKNSFELEENNKGYSSTVKNSIPNCFEVNFNLDNLENDFIIQNNFNNFSKNNFNNKNNINNFYNNDTENFDNLVDNDDDQFNTNVRLHTDNFNSIDNIDKSKINRRLLEKENKQTLFKGNTSSNSISSSINKNNINNRKSAKETFSKNSVLEKQENKNSVAKIKKKKIDLNKTPLPIFACIYCSNEKVVFTHMCNEILSDKYLYNCSPQDLKNMNIIVSTYFVFNLSNSVNAEIKSLVNLILNYSEFLTKFNSTEKSKQFIRNYADKSTREREAASYKPMLKFRFFCTENTMITFLFRNTSNFS